jgi:hypothetical protein
MEKWSCPLENLERLIIWRTSSEINYWKPRKEPRTKIKA